MTLPSGEETSENLTASPGVESWILSLHHFLANHSQMLENGRENSILKGVISGPIHSESFARWNPDSLSWRTSPDWQPPQDSISRYLKSAGNSVYLTKTITSRTQEPSIVVTSRLMDTHTWDELSGTFPASALVQNGRLSVRQRQEPRTSATGGGLWHIPTPTSADVYTGNLKSSQQSDDSMHSVSLPDFVGRFPTPSTMDHIDRKQMRPSRAATNRKTGYLSEMIGNWPTPTSTERSGTNPNTGKGEGLSKTAKMYPTPRAGKTTDEDEESWLARHADGKVATPPLALAAKLWATPRVDDSKNNGSASQQERHGPALNVQIKQMLPTPSSGGESGGPHGIRGGSWAKEKLVETFGEEDAVAMSGGSLSPDWVEWLMGIPLGWSSMQPLSSDEYLYWFHAQQDGTWWQEERGLPRVATGIKDRVNRLKCLGNGIVPASLSLFLRGTR